MNVIPLLKRIQEESNLIPNIASGGCCVFAALVSRQLKLLGIDFRFLVSNGVETCDGLDLANENFNLGNNPAKFAYENVSFYHVFLAVETEDGIAWFDNNEIRFDGVVPSYEESKVYSGCLDEGAALALAATGGRFWNNCFKRSDISILNSVIKRAVCQIVAPK